MLEKKSLGDTPLIEGTLIPTNLQKIYLDILEHRHEIYKGCLEDENYNYIKAVWSSLNYNAFDKFKQLDFLLPFIKQSLELVNDNIDGYFLKSWINIWPQGQSIGFHTHYGTWHGYYVIKDTETSTYYFPKGVGSPVRLKNYDGHFVFTSSKVPHMAQNNPSLNLRMSVGFNIATWDEVVREERNSVDLPEIKIIESTTRLSDYFKTKEIIND